VGAEHHVDPGRSLHDRVAVLLGQAAADGDLHAGMAVLDGPQVAEVSVQAVVGVLPDRARVEDDDVGRVALVGAGVAGVLEEPGEPFGVVHVHLAPVRANLIGTGGGVECRGRVHLNKKGYARPAPGRDGCSREPRPSGLTTDHRGARNVIGSVYQMTGCVLWMTYALRA
jgi:hypothetical protein